MGARVVAEFGVILDVVLDDAAQGLRPDRGAVGLVRHGQARQGSARQDQMRSAAALKRAEMAAAKWSQEECVTCILWHQGFLKVTNERTNCHQSLYHHNIFATFVRVSITPYLLLNYQADFVLIWHDCILRVVVVNA